MTRALTQDEFIERATQLNNGKYDYSKVVYKNNRTPVTITCPIHGDFNQVPGDHLRGHQCIKCRDLKHSKGIDRFITEARGLHQNRYTYNKVDYRNSHIPVTITCPIHGDFNQTPGAHLQGNGCPHCKYPALPTLERKKELWEEKSPKVIDTNSFIEKARLIHKHTYDYSNSQYKSYKIPLTIRCFLHGDFQQTPHNHLNGKGCPECGRMRSQNSSTGNITNFIGRARNIHGGKYDYSKAVYTNSQTPLTISCPIHGDFNQTPNNHLKGKGCMQCGLERMKLSRTGNKEDFIEKANKVHDNYYNYDNVLYVTNINKVSITCPIHGEFLCTPNNHLSGKGCPTCSRSKGELLIEKILKKYNVRYIKEFTLSHTLTGNTTLRVDFYLPETNTIIEFHGEQHFRCLDHFHESPEDYILQIERDDYLRYIVNEYNIKYLEFNYKDIIMDEDRFEKVLMNRLRAIKKHREFMANFKPLFSLCKEKLLSNELIESN